ncbi:YjcQ family protein [Alicyclobacillus fastidiosus]|uniref:YjcQ family protein n=1 Tax=Alicyclobacillus fastidiosus TaxID=392011 RepID=A0ABV5AJF4_9BACL|nr:YjcQ family protein [Alicyclobacillus fastidiosus]WEH08348.1 YjcQ family protein [Alicyclobacillus fastidiosus]
MTLESYRVVKHLVQEMSKAPEERNFVTAKSLGISHYDMVTTVLELEQNRYITGARYIHIDQVTHPVKVSLDDAEVTPLGLDYYMKHRDIT